MRNILLTSSVFGLGVSQILAEAAVEASIVETFSFEKYIDEAEFYTGEPLIYSNPKRILKLSQRQKRKNFRRKNR